eukprot:CAMPEP_0181334474 /NCGR_PEP_ID=MMETSP1101-20121128/26284_1 /TAXON_ID=46948 /ORGANISM="Rhodomonas abbreviata, Strain Caron Lab Isolate" /LENGTH=438 /DNA_ID=CAMNT_0023444463 /DNA_START=101 /DNA_END=1417 /DNA_ORIENTATION=-
MQERRKFGPLGWNIAYDYSNSDRDCCIKQLRVFLDKYETVPFKVIVQLSGDVNYGGRITDDWDRRTMNTLLVEYVCEEAMEDNYQFSADASYLNPPACKHSEYMEVLKTWPLQPHPEAFGLHENADITCAQNEVKGLFETILTLQPRVSTGGGLRREDIIDQTAEGILEKLPNPWLMLDIQKMYPVVYEESQNTVLQQECMRYNKLLVVMKQTLLDVRKALKGLIVMSTELDEVSNSLFNNQVPGSWESKAYPSLKPLVLWQEDLLKRCAFIQNWVDHGIPATFWISGFFFPQAFLTGASQNYARKLKIGIDTIQLDFRNQSIDHSEITEKPEDGVIVWGLFLEGARWDVEQSTLAESRPKELFTPYVPIWLCPVQNRPAPDLNVMLMCPCYKVLTRKGTLSTTGHSTNFVTTFEVPTAVRPEHWIKRGVALFLALAY